MSFFKRNPFVAIGLLAIILVGLPAAIFLSQNRVENRSRAAKSVVLSFMPTSSQSSPIGARAGSDITLDLMLDPGQNLVSFLRTEIIFDPSKVQITGTDSFQVNTTAFPQTIQSPSVAGDKLGFSISVGADGTKAIQAPTKVGTLTVKALTSSVSAPQLTQISFGENTLVLSIGSESTYTENVLSSTSPAYLLINSTTITTTPSASRCSDTIDNDNNGFIDAKDSTCHTDNNPNNPNSYDPNRDGEHGGYNTCADSRDNNNNNLIDGGDPICHTDGNANNPDSYNPNLPEGAAACINYIASLTGSNEVPPNSSNGLARAAFTIGDNNEIYYNVNVGGLELNKITAVHIHSPAAVGSNAPDRVTLFDGSGEFINPIGGATNIIAQDIISDIKSGRAYVNLHTEQFPNGELRGQIACAGNGTTLSLTVFLHGIGASGDNSNPTGNSLSNKTPKHTTRRANVSIYDTTNKLVATSFGDIVYSSASGNYKGNVTTSTPVPAGSYNVRVGTNQHLFRRIAGIQNIASSGANILPAIALVTGDIDDNNKLDILDYNALIGCYTDLLPAPSCVGQAKQLATDINDDGLVNQTDYNLFLREIANQPGE